MLPPHTVDDLLQLFDLLLGEPSAGTEGRQERRQTAAEGLFHILLTVAGVEFLPGEQARHRAALILEDAPFAQALEHREAGGLLPGKSNLTQLGQLPGGQRLVLPDQIRKPRFRRPHFIVRHIDQLRSTLCSTSIYYTM